MSRWRSRPSRRSAVAASPRPWGVLCVALALGIGWLVRWPLLLTYLGGWQLAMELGWVPAEPTWNDPVGPLVLTGVALWSIVALFVGGLTCLARWCTRLPARQWWWTSALLWVAPFAVLDLSRIV